jgi:ATP-dependent exoDNAse (exonuclease V) beta subunit
VTRSDDARLHREDAEARQLAQREFRRPLVLEAGAGTGKTATLVARIAAWSLGEGWRRAERALADRGDDSGRVAARVLGRVVAITFTEAAAAEMATRVDEALRIIGEGGAPVGLDLAVLPPEALRRPRADSLRGALDHLVVHTIHAWCRRLLATHPLEARLHPRLEVDAEGRAQELLVRDVLERRLREAYAEPGDADFLELAERGHGPGELEAELRALLEAGVPSVALSDDPLSEARVRAAAAGLRDASIRFHDVAGECLHEVRRGNKATRVASAVDAALARLEELPDSRAALEELLDWLRECFDAKAVDTLRTWSRGTFTASEREALGERADALRGPARELAGRVAHFTSLDLEALALARPVLQQLLHEVEERARRSGVVTFAGLLSGAGALLSNHPDVARRARAEIDQLLVDEFQDTDRRQCEVVGALALQGPEEERPGLFLVGDPTQSIYGWRSADLAAYDAFVERVGEEGGSVHALTVNHRSVPAILDEVERVIAPVMERVPGLQPAFQRLVPNARNEEDAGFGDERFAPIEYWLSAVRKEGEEEAGDLGPTRAPEATALEARALAADLRRLHDARGVAWSDVGILFRSRGDWDVYLGALREAGVPFSVEGDRSYYRRREIIDAAALVRTVLDPNDQVALVTLLRGAAVGVPDAALVPLWARRLPAHLGALERPDPRALAVLRELLDEVVAALPPDVPGLARVRGWDANLLAAARAIAVLRRSFDVDPADVFVERLRGALLLEVSEAARFLGAWRVANLERFFRELTEDLSAGTDTWTVLRRLRRAVADEEPGEEGQPCDQSLDAVRVLTLHGAKGLDFEHVYLMQLHKGPGGGPEPGPGAREIAGRFEYRLCGAPTLDFDRAAGARQATAEAERVRTLYVGMTRAKRRLVLAGLWPGFRRGGGPSHAALLERRDPAAPDLFETARRCLADAGSDRADAQHARWVFPALAADSTGPPAPAAAVEVPAADAVRADAERLRAARAEALARMARPLLASASGEAHEAADTEAQRPPPRASGDGDPELGRRLGTAIHRALETFDLDAELDTELRRQRELLADALLPITPPDRLADALEQAGIMLDAVGRGALLSRLRRHREDVVARELPVLALPGPDDRPIDAFSGTIDLVYRDAESDQLVVVDYKTDRIENEADLDARTRTYARQGAVYQRAVRDAFALDYTPRFELWYLGLDRRVVPDAAEGSTDPEQLGMRFDASEA